MRLHHRGLRRPEDLGRDGLERRDTDRPLQLLRKRCPQRLEVHRLDPGSVRLRPDVRVGEVEQVYAQVQRPQHHLAEVRAGVANATRGLYLSGQVRLVHRPDEPAGELHRAADGHAVDRLAHLRLKLWRKLDQLIGASDIALEGKINDRVLEITDEARGGYPGAAHARVERVDLRPLGCAGEGGVGDHLRAVQRRERHGCVVDGDIGSKRGLRTVIAARGHPEPRGEVHAPALH